jgi:prepilin-type processing-associated H-X9-DG protein
MMESQFRSSTMPISFSCPHCGAQTNVADQYAGQTGPCAKCGKPITVPFPASSGHAYAPAKQSSSTPVLLIVLLVMCVGMVPCTGVLIALLLPAVQAAREAARRTECVSNLKQIVWALQNYEDMHGTFPPAYIPDKDGKPMHSWRVLILPFMEQQELYAQYDFDQPWDSPTNMAVAQRMPKAFGCPSDPNSKSTTTSYMVISGPGMGFEGAKALKLADFIDGTSSTLLVVEVKSGAVQWTEPTDLDGSRMTFAIPTGRAVAGGGPPSEISSYHPGGAHGAFVDGSVRLLSANVSPQTLKALATRNGKEIIGSDF